MIHTGNSRWFALIPSILIVLLAVVCLASAQVVEDYTFESGAQGWTGFNGAAIVGTAAGASATVSFTIDFSRCHNEAPFVLQMPWSEANGADSHKLVLEEQP